MKDREGYRTIPKSGFKAGVKVGLSFLINLISQKKKLIVLIKNICKKLYSLQTALLL